MSRSFLAFTVTGSLVVALPLAGICHAQEPEVVGLVANRETPSASLFRSSEGFYATVPLPDNAQVRGSAVCPLTNGELIGAVADFNMAVHLVDLQSAAFLETVPISIPAQDLSCCGDHLIVASPNRPPSVVDLRRRMEVVQVEPELPNADSHDCSPGTRWVLVASRADDTIHLLDLDPVTGQLSRTGTELAPPSEPVKVLFSHGGACAVMERQDNTLHGFIPPTLALTDPTRFVPVLAVGDICANAGQIWARGGGETWVFPFSASCEVSSFLFSRITPSVSLFGVGSLACPEDGLVYVAIGASTDRVINEPLPPRVDVFDEMGDRVASFTDPGLQDPVSLGAVRAPLRRPPEIPSLGGFGLALLTLALLLAAVGRLRASRRRTPTR